MIIPINEFITVEEIQEHFSECFPGLEIQFFPNHRALRLNSPCSPKSPISEVNRKNRHGQVEIKSWHTAEKVERNFKELFGILIKIYLKKNNEYRCLHPYETMTASTFSPKIPKLQTLSKP